MSYNEEPKKGLRDAKGVLPLATLPPHPETAAYGPEIGPAPLSKTRERDRSVWESGDNYSGALFSLPQTAWRVAVCNKGYCWILQQRRAKDRWENRKYFAAKARLAHVLKELFGETAYLAVADKVRALPI